MIPFMAPIMMGQGGAPLAAVRWNATDAVNATVSVDALTAYGKAAGTQIRATTAKDGGKWYIEFQPIRSNENGMVVGVLSATRSLIADLEYGDPSYGGGYGGGGLAYLNGSTQVDPFVSGDVVSLAVDFDARNIVYRKNNVSFGSTSFISGLILKPFFSANKTTLGAKIVATGLTYAPPSGFLPWS